jgi:hypothetical protein
MESKDPVPTTDIEMSNFEKGGHTTLSTKTDDPPLKEASGLGLLANEDWILSLGSANAHNLDHIHADQEKVMRLQNRLTTTSTPWKFLPSKYMIILSKTFQCFEYEDYFDDPKKHIEQHNNLLELTNMFSTFYNVTENELLYDVCESFHKNIYPLLENFESHCSQRTSETTTPSRMKVRVDITYLYDVYNRVLLTRVGQARDEFSYLYFDDLMLAEKMKAISELIVDTSTADTTTSSSSKSSSPKLNIELLDENNSNQSHVSDAVSINDSELQSNRCRYCCGCLMHFKCCRRCLNRRKGNRYGSDQLSYKPDYLDPQLTLSDFLRRMIYERHKEEKRRRRRRHGIAYKFEQNEDDDDHEYDEHGNKKIKNRYILAKLGKACDAFITTLSYYGFIVSPFIPLLVNLILNFGLESETFFSYVPSERQQSLSYLLLTSAVADIITLLFLLTFLYKGSKRGRLYEINPGDRLVRIRPIMVMLIALFCGSTSLRYVSSVWSDGQLKKMIGLEDLVPFASLNIIAHIISILLIYSILKSFVKSAAKDIGHATYCNILCLCSFSKVIKQGRCCFKPAYRADVAGKGLHLLLRDQKLNERKLGYVMSFPDWNKNINTRKQVRYIRSQSKLFRKAVKRMKVEIAVKMMCAMYGSMEKVREKALPCEICVCAVFFTSYHNVKEHVLSNFRIRRQLNKVIAMDQVWYSLVTRYHYAKQTDDRPFLKSCERHLKIYLQKDRSLHQLQLSKYQAQERLKKSLEFAKKFVKNRKNKKRGNERNGGSTKGHQHLDEVPLPSSKFIYEGILAREELYKQLLNMQSEQNSLNSRKSSYNKEKLEHKHEDWSVAAAAANFMNVLHKGWSCSPKGINAKGNIEYLYYNRKLNAKLGHRITNGVSKKELPTYTKKMGITCPHSNLWTSKNIFETFHKIMRLNLPKYRRNNDWLKDYRVQLPHVKHISLQEYQWAGADLELHKKLNKYISKQNGEIEDSFQNMRQELNEATLEDTDEIDILAMGSSDDEKDSDEDA